MSQLMQNEKGEIWVGNEKFVPLITEEKIKERIKELGEQITEDYKGKLPIFIGILNGSFLFLADLVKHVKIHCEIDFFKLSSYGDEKISSGNVKLLKELRDQGKTILVVHHDLKTAEDYFDHALLLNTSLVASGECKSVLTPDNLARAYGKKGELFEEATRLSTAEKAGLST